MTRWHVTGLGEGGLRLSASAGELLERADRLDVAIAGAEANVLSSLARLDWNTAWASVLPASPMARRVERELRANGVSLELVSHVADGRLGIYFVEYGSAPRPTQVHFDRRDTAFARITSDQVDWDGVLDTQILHLTGVTAAISPQARAVTVEACARARQAGVTVSFDVNYRSRMWSIDDARPVLLQLAADADVLFLRQGDAQILFGTDSAEASMAAARDHSRATQVAITDGASGAIGSNDGVVTQVAATEVGILDRLGAGDAFAAGYLHGLLSQNPEHALTYAAHVAALCLAQRGEQVVVTRGDLNLNPTIPDSGLDR